MTETIALSHRENGNVPSWHNDASAYDWLNFFIKLGTKSSDITNPYKPLPNPLKIQPIVKNMLRRVFTSALSLNHDTVSKHADAAQTIDGPGALLGTVPVAIDRWVVSNLMFTLALVILIFMLFVAVGLFVWRPPKYLPRIPTSMASQMAYFASSSPMEDFRGMG